MKRLLIPFLLLVFIQVSGQQLSFNLKLALLSVIGGTTMNAYPFDPGNALNSQITKSSCEKISGSLTTIVSAGNGTSAITDLQEKVYPGILTVTNNRRDNASSKIAAAVMANNSVETIYIVSPANNSSHIPGNNITMEASASGSVSKVAFYNGATKIGEDLVAPYSFIWANAPVGSYSLTAQSFDNIDNLISTSATITIFVTETLSPNAWSLNGNAATSPLNNFIGTTDSTKLVFKTNNLERMTIMSNGNVCIGTTQANDPEYRLFVNTGIRTMKIKIDNIANWPDYVLKQSYELPSLSSIEKFIAIHGHLPGVPSAAEVKKNGINVGNTHALLLKKIEELSLYMIELNKKIEQLSKENELLKKQKP